MKKITGIVLTAMLLFSTLSACGSQETVSNTTKNTTQTTTQSSSQSTKQEINHTDEVSLSGTVKTGGSTSVEKVMTALIYQFRMEHPDIAVDYEMNGSGDGIKNTMNGLYDIGHSSRELKTDGSEDGLTPLAYAIDGIAVILHKDNQISDLSGEQLKKIYTGEITNWSEVGGDDALISVVTREDSSGTRSAFAEIIGLEKKDDPSTALLPTATTCNSTGAVQTTVSQNRNAIGYMSFSDVDTEQIQTAKYNGTEISTETLKDGSYMLKREFFLLIKSDSSPSPIAQAFIDFVLSAEGQALVQDNKLLPTES